MRPSQDNYQNRTTFDRTIHSLCSEIDSLKEEVIFWQEKYEVEKTENIKNSNDNLKRIKRDVGNALLFALSVNDNENGDLVISRENRKVLSENILLNQ